MTPRGKKFAVLVSACCALFAIAGVSSAAAQKPKAKAKVSEVDRTLVLPPNAVGFGLGEVNSPCPSNRTLTGGGSRLAPGTPLVTNIELVSSGPVGDSWETQYDNNTAVGQTTLGAALCIRNKLNVKGGEGGQVRPRVKRVTVPLALPPQTVNSGVAEADVACPRGYTVTSGGLRVIPGTPGTTSNEITAFESGPGDDDTWHVRYDNDSAVGANAEASALCLKNKVNVKKGEDGKARAKVREVTETVALPPQATNAGVAEFDVPCPGGTKLVGGGARFLPGALNTLNIELFESGPNGNAWHARFNNNTTVAQSVLVTANCLRRNLKVK